METPNVQNESLCVRSRDVSTCFGAVHGPLHLPPDMSNISCLGERRVRKRQMLLKSNSFELERY